MKYRFNTDDYSLKERICQINGIDPQRLDAKGFLPDYDLEVLKSFREILLSYKDKRFFIVGDYDCDGICATVIMKRLLDDLQIRNNYYIPSRSRDGYGINERIVKTAIENGFEVILCVDNGITANQQLSIARNAGLKVLVIDHHEYSEAPDADAYLHPNLFPEEYADMCAGGLCALLSNGFRYDTLSTVYGGLATLADMVSVFGYNRSLMKEMIRLINEEKILPIRYLAGSDNIDFDTLSFQVIPKINAVSRLDDRMNVNYVVRYLLDNSSECMIYLNRIEEINKTRKELTRQMFSLAERVMDLDQKIIVVCSEAFKEGLCGLIANRMMYEYQKPVIVLTKNGNELKGSGRSPKGSDLYGYLKQVENLFTTYGGHEQAVGLSINEDKLPTLLDHISSHELTMEEQIKDVIVLNQEEIDFDLLNELDELKPFGPDFPEPQLGIKDPNILKIYRSAGRFRKYTLNEKLDAIDFRHKEEDNDYSMLIGKLKRDDYHNSKLSFVIEETL
ncbi:MAG: DHH family phosphoesterase [Erysipelotrichaceae bacterium]|nr:DHH family phosphoesterase [Erysipelotrichaceae bacterium]